MWLTVTSSVNSKGAALFQNSFQGLARELRSGLDSRGARIEAKTAIFSPPRILCRLH
jgi:hypothetical protein